MPTSIIVVDTNILNSFFKNFFNISSFSLISVFPWSIETCLGNNFFKYSNFCIADV